VSPLKGFSSWREESALQPVNEREKKRGDVGPDPGGKINRISRRRKIVHKTASRAQYSSREGRGE